MSKSLIIVESPAKARTIEKFLGRRFAVRASMGHVRDLPKSQLGVDVDNGFDPKYITIRGKGDILKELREGARKAAKVYLATDPDREGEAISWHLAQILDLPQGQPCRIEFHEITRDAIQKAIKKPRPIDDRLVSAQQARRILDRLVGYKLSPLLWRKVRRGLSAGRVQSVAVRLICDREQEITSFVPEEYWSLTARLATAGGQPVEARFFGRGGEKVDLKTAGETRAVMSAVAQAPFGVTSVRKKERKRYPAFPFTTSSLQQEAARKLGFTVRRTMAVAQQLYEGLDLGELGHTGLITYIRTDSTRIAAEAEQEAAAYVRGAFGEAYLPAERREPDRKAGEQGAHEAIRPTHVDIGPDRVRPLVTPDQYKLYRLIWERFVASQMAPAVLDTVSVDIEASGYTFRASGSTVRFRGFMAVYIEGQDDEAPRDEDESFLPELAEGQALRLEKLEDRQHFTQPPPRFSEAMLVKALEEKGIGRPSTYAPIIETIQQRGYVTREDKRFVPTELGQLVVDILKEYFPDIIDVQFTADMEEELDAIESGVAEWRRVLQEFYGPFSATLQEAEEKIGGFELPDEESDELCERCGSRMVIKHGRFGRFLACPRFPECKFTKPIVEETGVQCPKCRQGLLVERRAKKRGRRFYGCNRYPDCDFIVWQKPVLMACPDCGGLLVEKRARDSVTYKCVNTQCSYEGVPQVSEVMS